MLHSPLLTQSSDAFWSALTQMLLETPLFSAARSEAAQDYSSIHIVVPTYVHVQLLKSALASQIGGVFIPPRITTLSAWLDLLPPSTPAASNSARLMSLYAELRQHAWLKKLFTARRNTDLLPLAQTLLTLSDELTQSLLPTLQAAEECWQAALAQLPPSARNILSDESQLVWSIWKSQLDGSDALAQRYTQMLQLAERADGPLVWVSPHEADAFETAFLDAYSQRQAVLPVTLDWRALAMRGDAALYAAAWPELMDDPDALPAASTLAAPAGLSLCPAKSLEDEAQQGAQTIVHWLQSGKTNIAVIAQDRVVARRMRALLERAQVFVADETGWKLSTTRAASAIVAWFEVVTSRAETIVLLDLLKSPFLFARQDDKTAQVMAIESALRSANVLGGWDAAKSALALLPAERELLSRLARQADYFAGRKTLPEWLSSTNNTLIAIGMRDALAADAAGVQVLALLDNIEQECPSLEQQFSFAEWRAFVSLQLESTAFVPPNRDNRVVMLPLNGARLRSFDAVLLVGADAGHLPSQPQETLFFANAVRRELGLATRESRQRQQLRDFVEVLQANKLVVLSWQAHKDGEPNPVSPWIARLQLTLARHGAAEIALHRIDLLPQHLTSSISSMPAPAAPSLLPGKLSASGYNSLVGCPYQFFATRMLGLSGLDELSDMPQKRDYGDWLHQILKNYHETVRDQKTALDLREILLRDVSEKIFGVTLDHNSAALGYYVRWQKIIPAYLLWANEREAQGIYFYVGEELLERPLTWQDGSITLHGRVDRIDQCGNGDLVVLDYKAQAQPLLSAKIKLQEDQQLAFYGLLSNADIEAAHYVALEATKGKISDVTAPRYPEWQYALGEQIKGNLRAISQGGALPANGIASICQYCDVRGLCRKGAW